MMKNSLTILSVCALTFMSCGETKQPETPAVVEDQQEQTNVTPPVTMGEPKVFYYDYTEQRGVEEALVMSKEDALREMKNLPEADGNFFGMELSDGSIVQFMYDEKKATWFLDIPNPVTQESYNADITMDDAVKIIGDVFGGKSADDVKAAY